MNQQIQHFYLFLSCCRGNWRNSVYIFSQNENDPGYLLAADRDGRPVVMSVEQLQEFTGEQIDPSECRGQLTHSAFKDIFAQYLLWKFHENGVNILSKLSHPE